MVSKANRTLGFIKRNLYSCSKEIKNLAYKSLVRPRLEYCGSVWDPHTKELTQKIEAVQNRSARFVCSDYERLSSVTSMKESLDWDLLETRRKATRVTIFHQSLTGHLAIPLENIVHPVRRSSRHSKFIQFQTSKNCLKYSFIPRTTVDWNNLPPTITSTPDKKKFKEELLQYYTRKATNN
ncbi:uncharacterized protein [Amphiura filiformis]|uniref:uncharacterized protein n=1 Tax=Amphiura filiformis TaxID=82378 RepID=UPI003B210966